MQSFRVSCDHFFGFKQKEMADCTFTPNRLGAQTSEKYLRRIGRKEAKPEDFMRYHEV